MAYRDNPPTACETCRTAEMTWWEKLQRRWGRTSPFGEVLQGFGIAFSTLAGVRPVGWYERHQHEWEKTGDQIELQRMLRHVEAPASR